MINTNTLSKRAGLLKIIAICAIAITALSIPLALLGGLRAGIPGLDPQVSPSTLHLLAIILTGALPAIATIWTLAKIMGLLTFYQRGEFLTHRTATQFSAIAKGLVAIVALGLISRPLQSVVASLSNAPGERVLAIRFESGDVALILAAGLVFLIGQTMAEAAANKDDLDGIV